MFLWDLRLLDSPPYTLLSFPLLDNFGRAAGRIQCVSFAMISDTIDYMEWKTNNRLDGIASSCQTFINKLGNAFAHLVYRADVYFDKLNPVEYVEGR